jgi:uncharacterized protein (TIGR02646 family)
MRAINKRAEPKALLEYRSSREDPNLTAANFPDAALLRTALLEDQGYLCCYCMGRIDIDRMKVEHLRSQAQHEELRASWPNLLAACRGNEGRPRAEQHCDSAKGHRGLRVHPLTRAVDRIRYRSDGTIAIDDPALQADLDQVLNLNQRDLKANRAQALSALLSELTNERTGAHWSAATLDRKLRRLREAVRLRRYLGVLEFWLAREIRRRSAGREP